MGRPVAEGEGEVAQREWKLVGGLRLQEIAQALGDPLAISLRARKVLQMKWEGVHWSINSAVLSEQQWEEKARDRG